MYGRVKGRMILRGSTKTRKALDGEYDDNHEETEDWFRDAYGRIIPSARNRFCGAIVDEFRRKTDSLACHF